MNGRPITEADAQYVREHYHVDQTAQQVAAALNRTVRAVYSIANKLGCCKPMVIVSDITIHAAINRFHPLGWSDSEISQWLSREFKCGVNRHRVGQVRKLIGLPINKFSDHDRERIAANTKEQLAKAGLSSLAELRNARFNEWKRSLGWPESLSIRAVQSLEMFYRRGPMTRMQLCAALGIDKKKRLARTEPKSNAKGGTVLAELMRAGLLIRLKKSVSSGRDRRGGIRKVDLYMLHAGVSPNVETRKESAVS